MIVLLLLGLFLEGCERTSLPFRQDEARSVQQADPETLLPRAISQFWRVVAIVRKDVGGKPKFLASGFVLIRGQRLYVVTNNHVIEEAKRRFGENTEFFASFHNKEMHSLRLVAAKKHTDVAILEADAVGLGDRLAPRDPIERVGVIRKGVTVYKFGFSEQDVSHITLEESKGSITWFGQLILRNETQGIRCPRCRDVTLCARKSTCPPGTPSGFLFRGPVCDAGSSGSPVFDDEGSILGYVVGAFADNSDCIAVSFEEAAALIPSS